MLSVLLFPLLLFLKVPSGLAVKCPLLEVTSNSSSGDFSGVYKMSDDKANIPRKRVYKNQEKQE